MPLSIEIILAIMTIVITVMGAAWGFFRRILADVDKKLETMQTKLLNDMSLLEQNTLSKMQYDEDKTHFTAEIGRVREDILNSVHNITSRIDLLMLHMKGKNDGK